MAISKSEMERRNNRMLDAAFQLFVENSIEIVTMQNIADEAEVGVASVFRYYPSKVDLVLAVCNKKWKEYFTSVFADRKLQEVEANFTAYERMAFTLDQFINLYKNYKGLLVFNENLNSYVLHERVPKEKLEEYEKNVGIINERFHSIYECAKVDKTIRTDLSEEQLKRISFQTMMAACTHYANGLLWGALSKADYTSELEMTKEMILDFLTKK